MYRCRFCGKEFEHLDQAWRHFCEEELEYRKKEVEKVKGV